VESVKISVCCPVAYDYRYLYDSIRSYYSICDEILLGLDQYQLTWAKRAFAIDRKEFDTKLLTVDPERKIRIIEDNFHGLDKPMDNENNERNVLLSHCKPDNLIVQIDVDEYCINPQDFKTWVDQGMCISGYCAYAKWATVFKVIDDTALVIAPSVETVPLANPDRLPYTAARSTGQPGNLSPLWLLHYSWGRTLPELQEKLANWGHANDFDINAYIKFWMSVNLHNYKYMKDFHPLNGTSWPALKAVPLKFLEKAIAKA
jgi:hypothetical protein